MNQVRGAPALYAPSGAMRGGVCDFMVLGIKYFNRLYFIKFLKSFPLKNNIKILSINENGSYLYNRVVVIDKRGTMLLPLEDAKHNNERSELLIGFIYKSDYILPIG